VGKDKGTTEEGEGKIHLILDSNNQGCIFRSSFITVGEAMMKMSLQSEVSPD